jgi:RNA polymerase-associated protein RTF1
VSNSAFTANEFSAWKDRLEKDKLELPNRSFIEQRKKAIVDALGFQYKDGDIDTMLKEKEKFNKTPRNYAMKKSQLMRMKDDAELLGNHDDVERLHQEIDSLDDRAKELDKARTNSIAAISYINERNRIKNISEAEKAIMEERMAYSKQDQEDDPFRRRTCRPTLVHKFHKNIKTEGGDVMDANGVKVEPGAEGPLNGAKPLVTNIPIKIEKTPSSPTHDQNDLFSAHNFDIQIDFEMAPGGAHMSHASSTHQHSFGGAVVATPQIAKPANRRSLNLEEYKKKKGLI